MLIEERRREIVRIINAEGRGLVKDLAPHFHTSQFTIRKDLEALHLQGIVHRTYGGALPVQTGALLDPSLLEREKAYRKEKQRIGEAAAKLVKEGQCVILDSGSTTRAIAHALRHMAHLTVITNGVNIAAELAGTSIQVILTGGILNSSAFSMLGPVAEATLRQFTADLLFLGVNGFDAEVGVTSPNVWAAKVESIMVEVARRTVLVCDSSKFGRRFLCVVARPPSIDQVITDTMLRKKDRKILEDAGIQVMTV